MIKKFSIIAAALMAAAVITGCKPNVEGGSSGAENTAEAYTYYGSVSQPRGALEVTVQGEKASAVFASGGKNYRGEGTVSSEGAVAVELASEADSANKYTFSGSYDGEKKAFTKGSFGKSGGALSDVVLSSEKGSKLRPFYYGLVYGTGLKEYEVTVTVKDERSVAVMFARVISGNLKRTNKPDKVYQVVEGVLSGKKVTANVRLEGELFTFETLLNDNGYLRETRLIGERAFTGERMPTLIHEYEAKGIDEHASKKSEEHFKGDLTVTVHLSPEAYRQAKRDKEDTAKVGDIFVTFHELTETNQTRMYKGQKPLLKNEYEKGVKVNLYNLLDRESEIGNRGATTDERGNIRYGNIENNDDMVKFVLLIQAKNWYDPAKHTFKGARFGRAKKQDALLGKGHAVSDKLVYIEN